MKKIAILLTLLICGCGSSVSQMVPVSPAQAQSSVADTAATGLVGSFGDGRTVTMNLRRIGASVDGQAVTIKGEALALYQVNGTLTDKIYSLTLHPTQIAGNDNVILLNGRFGAPGVWQEAANNTSGSLSLEETNVQGRLLDGALSEGPSPEVFSITCSANDDIKVVTVHFQVTLSGATTVTLNGNDFSYLTGTWTSDIPIGYDHTSSGQAQAQSFNGQAGQIVLSSDEGLLAAGFIFPLPAQENGATVTVDLDSSYLEVGLFDANLARNLTSGELTVVSTGL